MGSESAFSSLCEIYLRQLEPLRRNIDFLSLILF